MPKSVASGYYALPDCEHRVIAFQPGGDILDCFYSLLNVSWWSQGLGVQRRLVHLGPEKASFSRLAMAVSPAWHLRLRKPHPSTPPPWVSQSFRSACPVRLFPSTLALLLDCSWGQGFAHLHSREPEATVDLTPSFSPKSVHVSLLERSSLASLISVLILYHLCPLSFLFLHVPREIFLST